MIKKNIFTAAFATLLLSTLATVSQAQDSARKYVNCREINQIKSPPNSAGFYLSGDCKTAYVLPPAIGAIGLASYVDEIGAEGELCSTVNGSMHDMFVRKQGALQELQVIESRNHEINREQAENRSNCLEIDSYATSSENKLRANQQAQTDIKTKIQQIDAQIFTCSGSVCDNLRSTRQILSDKLEMLQISEEGLESSATRYATKKSSCHADQDRNTQALDAELTQNQTRTSVLLSSLTTLTQSTNLLFESQRAEAGGMMSITVSSEQTELTQRFRELNPNLGVQFIEMPLSDVSLSFTQITDGVANGYPTLLKANISGTPVNADSALNRLPFGGGSAAQQIVFGAAVGGSLTINRFAACQLPAASNYGTSVSANRRRLKDIAGLFSGTATYRYQLAVSRKIKIHYNEKQLYCLIRKQSSSSGLFKSSSASSVTESSQANQWLSIDVESEDTGFDFANRDTLLMDLRSEMLDRALMKVATSYLDRERAQLVAPEAPRADGMANEIRKCPQLYCQAAALALNLGSALFGGTDSTSSTCEDVGASSQQDFTDTKPMSAFGTQGFGIKATNGT